MEKNSTTAAPQFENMSGVYDRWLDTHTGTEREFLDFISTPSAERDMFLSRLKTRHEVSEGVLLTTYIP